MMDIEKGLVSHLFVISIDRLFREDKQKFIEYNFVDVLILKKLDE